ncbi:MAG: O-antigen ligase family protein [Ignavibacterium sp.]|nr:O-antigen ligase family protein [Ignavibacterium sp.]
MQITSRFNSNISLVLIAGLSISYVLSLFLLQLFAVSIFLLWLFEKNSEKKKAFDKLTFIIIAFGVIRLLSIFFSEYPASSNESLYKEALFYISFAALHFYLKTFDKKIFSSVVLLFILGAGINALIAIVKFNFSIDERAQSFSSGYAAFSSYILAALGLALFYRQSIHKKYNDYLWAVILSMLIAALITSLGRTNIALATVIILTAIVLKQFSFKVISAVLVLTVLLTLLSFSNNKTSSLQSRVESPTQLSDRDIIFKGAEELAFEHPVLGFGPRTFHDIFPFKDEFADKGIGTWHNDFLQVYFESGVLGLIVFLILIFYLFYVSIINIRSKKLDKDYKKIAAGVFAAIFLLTASGLTAGFITSPVLSIVFVFLITTLSAINNKASVKKES